LGMALSKRQGNWIRNDSINLRFSPMEYLFFIFLIAPHSALQLHEL
jgi:hypothetical protein